MLARFENEDADQLLNTPELVSLLYGWMQGGGEEAAKRWVAALTDTPSGLVEFLSRVRGWRASNDRVYHPLNRRDVGRFTNYDEALQRLQEIVDDATAGADLRQKAQELLLAAQQDRNDDD
jgi:hypothetical protein